MMATTLSADDAATLTAYLERTSMPVEEGTRERIIAACELVIMSLRIPIEAARKNAFLTLGSGRHTYRYCSQSILHLFRSL
jgi:hypothetical protein